MTIARPSCRLVLKQFCKECTHMGKVRWCQPSPVMGDPLLPESRMRWANISFSRLSVEPLRTNLGMILIAVWYDPGQSLNHPLLNVLLAVNEQHPPTAPTSRRPGLAVGASNIGLRGRPVQGDGCVLVAIPPACLDLSRSVQDVST